MKELLAIFETYNFTIDENTPVDVELSIEPEMLGRIFENLLAEINPETGETARKATGSYYTPRPIVEYMVDESLKQYLLTKTDVSEDKITQLLSYSDYDGAKLTEKQIQTLVEALHQARIIDPACGSGAFPMGILQKIFLMLQKLDPASKIWLEKMLANIPDPMYRKELKKKNIPKYLHKLGIIKDCIFGVDIQPIAVEISKLRCFLSLIVDENVNDDEINRGIEHLPNLEFKFVCANSLIGLPQKVSAKTVQSQSKYGPKEYKDQNLMFEATDKIGNLKELRDLYLTSYGKEKKDIEKQFRKVQSEMLQHSLSWGGKHSQTLKLSQWDPFSDETCSWFDPDWMFGIKDGFDIVIGNPPYSAKQSTETKKLRVFFKCVEYKCDPYAFFIEHGLRLVPILGNVTYIVPVTWMTNVYYEKLRKEMIDSRSLKHTALIEGLAFESANVDTSILFLYKEGVVHETYKWTKTDTHLKQLQSSYRSYASARRESRYDIVPRVDPQWDPLRLKLDAISIKLGSFCKISLGMKLKSNALYISSSKDRHHQDPIIFGDDISFYEPLVPSRFFSYKNAIIVGGTKNPNIHHTKHKILVQAIRNLSLKRRIVATLDTEGLYFVGTVNSIIPQKEGWDLYYLLGLINSKLLNVFFAYRFTTISLTAAFLGELPIVPPESNGSLFQSISKAVSNCFLENNEKKKLKVENQIDQMVYKLYGLTKEEIAIVEGKNE